MNTNPQTTVECPGCGASVVWNDDYPHRPFCSRRCKDADFIDWAKQQKSIAGTPSYDDIFSEAALPDDYTPQEN